MRLSEPEFLEAVRMTPLVSIDLIVRDRAHRVLVGERRNRPACGAWFVPGGRIRKDERLDAAFTRIVVDELGMAGVERRTARFCGVFEHLYADNFAGQDGVSTHYVVLAYALMLDARTPIGRFEQHARYAWLLPAQLLADPRVHENTRAYFC